MNGIIAFESATSEFLECSCGNTVMDSGFDQIDAEDCALMHYQCAKCNAFACVDDGNRVVTDADDHILTNIVGEVFA
tara:strand:- start:320 stop:550 length:231 start_codon:yes stop_codon:yes gene_type:complete